jgi:endoglucanase
LKSHSRLARIPSAAAALAVAVALTGACSARTEPVQPAAQRAAAADGFYVDPDSNAVNWVKAHSDDSRAGEIRSAIAEQPMAKWFGNWSGDVGGAVSGYTEAAASAGKVPILVAYNIPGRDCNGASSGGAGSPEAYRTWISQFAGGVADRDAVVVIEPDAVAQIDCLPNDTERTTRLGLLKYATEQFKAKAPAAKVYLDAGNAKWIAAGTMATRLKSAGIANVRGFVVNVSNYYTTAQSSAYAGDVNTALGKAYPYVVDTSRNGNGSKEGEWCNPAGRKLGATSRTGTAPEMELWVKDPGDSDGPCGTAPDVPAGQFSPDLADHLIKGD